MFYLFSYFIDFFIQWLKIYPATGYIVTSAPDDAGRCIQLFEDAGITARVIGEITDDKKLTITSGEDSHVLLDFEQDIVTGIAAR